ncbi:hypothetical protein [Neogemmobacter tilapiae]|uniref:Calcium-binding protein n=1 Tax=Neogemmobacter tilapiae TaxID=875041 RepID=A0A918TQ56_9RHOB|nr:hypothetical protein [Gemmobacter tilapiae]GHC58345.1 hypothetical protein GCM10007315_22480 [Gemmobacter tilapiae]
MLIKAKTKIGDPTAYTLAVGEDLLVGRNVVLQSNAGNAVLANGFGDYDVTIHGKVSAAWNAVRILTTGACTVTIGEDGALFTAVGAGTGLALSSSNSTVHNAGTIFSAFIGIHMNASVAGGVAELTNSGNIFGTSYGVLGDALAKMTVTNTGSIQGGLTMLGGTLIVQNSGQIIGPVKMGNGAGLIDNSKGGITFGIVEGEGGNDIFRAGRAMDDFDGGDGVDTMDYRAATGAVWVDLDTPANNKGWAKGDVVAGIEILVGSGRGDDRLVGYLSASTDLRGLGGADTILGGNVADRIVGGAGKDLLSGFLGDDMFIYNNVGEGGDRISDFQSAGVAEFLAFARAGFGFTAGGILSAIKPGAFHESTTNRAGDRGDRFIWESDATKLWFDRDGSGGRYAPVLIADLQAGATLTAADILIL